MSTRYSTYPPVAIAERAIEGNNPARPEPLRRTNRVASSVLDGVGLTRGPNVWRQVNEHQPVPAADPFERARLTGRVTARDLMTPCAATLRPEESIERAALLLRETTNGSVPVVDGAGRLIGIITDHDITVKLVALGTSIPHAQVSDCMTSEAFACSAGSSLESCISAMSWHQLRRIPIVDDEHRVVGIISQGDVASYLCEHPETVEHGAMADVLWAMAY